MNTTNYDYPAEYINLPEERKANLRNWIKENLKPIKNINSNYSSYGLKYLYEKDTGEYVSNDEFKGGMLEAGFIPDNVKNLNWYFNISNLSITVVNKRVNDKYR